jgi:hypothetical protein
MNNPSRTFFLGLILIIVVCFIYSLVSLKSPGSLSFISSKCECEANQSAEYADLVKAFYDIAIKHKTDKVTAHSYQYLYGLYLSPIRYKSIQMLEIGVGCGMPYGAGKSIIAWKEYFLDVKVDIVEFDRGCAERFRSQVNNLFIGDQSDLRFLKKIRARNSYDLIVDDGGHSRKQQIHSLISLWDSVKPGGIYVIEDIYFGVGTTRYYQDYDVSTVEVLQHLIMLFSKQIEFTKLPSLDKHLKSIFKSLLSVNCFAEACVLIKKI